MSKELEERARERKPSQVSLELELHEAWQKAGEVCPGCSAVAELLWPVVQRWLIRVQAEGRLEEARWGHAFRTMQEREQRICELKAVLNQTAHPESTGGGPSQPETEGPDMGLVDASNIPWSSVEGAVRPSQPAPLNLSVVDVAEIIMEMTNGVHWKLPDVDGQISRFTDRLNALLSAAPFAPASASEEKEK